MTRDEDETQTSAPDTVVDLPDPALAPTVQNDSADGQTPPHQIVIHTTLEGLPQPGERVGRYELGQVIGRGGMGVVYKARDPELDRALAIKVVLPATSGKRSQQRLLDEARAMAKLHHPAVVPVFDVGTTDCGVYVVMPFLAGGTLGEWASAKPRPWREVLSRYIAAGRGLAAAHAAGLVHRDFKPRNVMLGDNGQVMVGDFGLAEDTLTPHPAAADGSATSSLEGTPAYMAPEQSAGRPVDARADQFSFCISLWEGLHGERPTEASTRGGLLTAATLPAVPADRRGAPGWLLSAIGRGWESSPDRRWPSMTALLDHIERRLRLPRRIAIGSAAIGVVGVAAAVVLAAPARHENPCPDPRARMATIWSPDIRARVEASFTATGLSYAPDTLARILPVLDRYAEDWRKKHVEVCRAGSVEKTQSIALLDQRMACLDRRFSALRARTIAFADANATVVENAMQQLDDLQPVSDCDETERLLSRPLPSSSSARARIAELDVQLDDITAAIARGEQNSAIPRLEALLPAARELGYAPVHERLLRELTAAKGLDLVEESLLRERIDAAARAQDDVSIATAWILLAHRRLSRSSGETTDEIDAMLPVIRAAVLRAGESPLLVADENSVLMVRALKRGDVDEAIRLGRDTGNLPTTPLVQASALNNLALVLQEAGRPKEAIDPAQRSLTLTIEALGERHPRTAAAKYRLAQLAIATGDADRGATLLAQAAEIQRTALGAHPDLAKTLITLANLASARGDSENAQRAAEEARTIFESIGDRGGQASALATLAELAKAQHGFDAARPHYERSLELIAEARGKNNPAYALAEANLASAFADAKRCTEAIPLYSHAVDVLKQLDDQRFALVLGTSVRCDRDDPVGILHATAKYEIAVEACEKLGCPPDMALSFRFGLGAALHHSERDVRRGLELIRAARAEAVAKGIQPMVDQIDAWTKKHRVRI